METLRPIATDTADFPQLRRDGKIYVDKTGYLYDLVANHDTKLFFLSRPRRFGKSLMISTLKAIFQSRRELFDGLAISKTDWKWEKYPIIHLDMSNVETLDIDTFESSLVANTALSLSHTGYEYDKSVSPAINFGNAIDTTSDRNNGKGVVILIDEYDAPVAHALDDIALADAIRKRLSSFYIQMKSRTGSIRFLMMTGVSKFTKMSVFSALNNIVDVSMRDEYATMLGYTEDELTANFEPHLRVHAKKMGMEYGEYRAEMKRWYNGFRFAKYNPETVYSPISIALALSAKEPAFSSTWADTGRPSMLMNLLKHEEILALDYERIAGVSEAEFDVADLSNLRTIGMLLQAGYLTIRDFNRYTSLFTLGVPDEEVRRDLAMLLTGVAAEKDMAWAASLGGKLLTNNWQSFFDGLKSLYSAMAYGSTEESVHENSFGRCLSFLLASCGFRFRMEDVQSDGRADVIAEHPVGIYIFELKVGEPTGAAFAQIEAKGYAEPYRADSRPIWLVALSFDRQTRRLVDCAARRG